MNVEIKLKRGESLLFEVEESMMQNALEEGFAKIDELQRIISEKALDINPETTLGERQEEFECTICLNIVQKPTQCTSCDTIFCTPCISQMHQSKCPTCLLQNAPFKPIDRVVTKFLHRMSFTCQECHDPYSYTE